MSNLVLPAKCARKANADELRQTVCDHVETSDDSTGEDMNIAVTDDGTDRTGERLDKESEYTDSNSPDRTFDKHEDAELEGLDVDDASSACDADIEDNGPTCADFGGRPTNIRRICHEVGYAPHYTVP